MEKLLQSFRRQPWRSHQSAKFLPRIAAAAIGTKEKLPHLPTRESLQLLLLAVITFLQGAPSG